jgi:hypothetical protein
LALVKQHYQVNLQLLDAGGNKTSRTYRMRGTDTAGDISALLTLVSTLVSDLEAITYAKVYKYTLGVVFVDTAWTLPTEGNVEEHALITAKIYGNPLKSATIDIPAPVDGIFIGSPGDGKLYNEVDTLNDSDLASFLLDFAGASSDFMVSDGEAISTSNTDWVGKRTHSHSVKG